MNDLFEQEKSNGGIYNREVLSLLFKYIYRYKHYLFISLFFVALIAGVTIATPYIARIIIDRSITKLGYSVNTRRLFQLIPKNVLLFKKLQGNNTVALTDTTRFLFQSEMHLFSKREFGDYVNRGIINPQQYVLVENAPKNGTIHEKLERLQAQQYAEYFKPGQWLIRNQALKQFTVPELLLLRSGDLNHILYLVLLVAALFILQFCASYGQIYTLMRLSHYAMRDLRNDLFARIVCLEVAFFDKNPIGKLVNRVTNDIEVLNEMFSSVLVTLLQDILMMIGIAIVMFTTDWYLASLVAITFPAILLLTYFFSIKVRTAYRVIRTRIADLNSYLQEAISGIRIIQIFVQEIKSLGNFKKINRLVYTANMQQLYVFAIFRPLIDFLRWFAIATVLYFGCQGILDDRLSYGLIVMFLTYIGAFFEPISDFSEKFDTMQSATAAGEKILSIFKTGEAVEHTQNNPPSLPAVSMTHRFMGTIEFQDVWFRYKPDEWVLRGVSFCVEPKETLAVVGETGSGKTTIISLLAKFYPVTKGKILIDGIDLAQIPVAIMRKNCGLVMQDIFLFTKTVRENIILNSPFNKERFDFVTKITTVDQFIQKLPNKEMQAVMERGVTFSAGERQLLSFCRALYFDPSILILDEATAHIDTETERRIQAALSYLIAGRTSIIVAHRLSTIQHAQKIIVLDKGIIAEAGTHKELLEKESLYHTLYKLQYSAV